MWDFLDFHFFHYIIEHKWISQFIFPISELPKIKRPRFCIVSFLDFGGLATQALKAARTPSPPPATAFQTHTTIMSGDSTALSCWAHHHHHHPNPGAGEGALLDEGLPLAQNEPSRGVFLVDYRAHPPPNSKWLAPAQFGKGDFRAGSTTAGAKRSQWDGYDSDRHHTIILLYPELAPPPLGKTDLLALASATVDQPFVVTVNRPKAKVVSPKRILVLSTLSISDFYAREDARFWSARALFQEIDLEFRHVAMCDLVRRRGRRRSKKDHGKRLNISLLFAEAAAQQIGRKRLLAKAVVAERRT